MIVFDLACRDAHIFEIWFGSSSDYASQKARGLIACPYCGSTDIEKAVMAPRVGAKGNQRTEAAALPVPSPTADAQPSAATPVSVHPACHRRRRSKRW